MRPSLSVVATPDPPGPENSTVFMHSERNPRHATKTFMFSFRFIGKTDPPCRASRALREVLLGTRIQSRSKSSTGRMNATEEESAFQISDCILRGWETAPVGKLTLGAAFVGDVQ